MIRNASMEPTLSMSSQHFEDCRLISASGRIDFSSARQFLETLQAEVEALGKGGGLVVELSGLDLITSAGLRALMQTKQALAQKEGRLVIASPSDTVAKVIRIARFDTLLTLAPTVLEGLQLLSPDAAAAYRGE